MGKLILVSEIARKVNGATASIEQSIKEATDTFNSKGGKDNQTLTAIYWFESIITEIDDMKNKLLDC